jgi:hypothetical protein
MRKKAKKKEGFIFLYKFSSEDFVVFSVGESPIKAVEAIKKCKSMEVDYLGWIEEGEVGFVKNEDEWMVDEQRLKERLLRNKQ